MFPCTIQVLMNPYMLPNIQKYFSILCYRPIVNCGINDLLIRYKMVKLEKEVVWSYFRFHIACKFSNNIPRCIYSSLGF